MSHRTLGIAGVNDRSAGLLALNFNSAVVSGIGSGNIGTQQLFANTVFQIGDTFLASYRTHVVHVGLSSDEAIPEYVSMPATTAGPDS